MACARGCCPTQRDHYRSVTIAPSATPSRHSQAAEVNAREGRWQRDMAAYRRLRQDGLQPARIDGSATVEAKAETKLEVERSLILTDTQRRQVESLRSDGAAI